MAYLCIKGGKWISLFNLISGMYRSNLLCHITRRWTALIGQVQSENICRAIKKQWNIKQVESEPFFGIWKWKSVSRFLLFCCIYFSSVMPLLRTLRLLGSILKRLRLDLKLILFLTRVIIFGYSKEKYKLFCNIVFHPGLLKEATPALSICFKFNPKYSDAIHLMRQESAWFKISITSLKDHYGFIGVYSYTRPSTWWRMVNLCGDPTVKWHSFCFVVDNSMRTR